VFVTEYGYKEYKWRAWFISLIRVFLSIDTNNLLNPGNTLNLIKNSIFLSRCFCIKLFLLMFLKHEIEKNLSQYMIQTDFSSKHTTKGNEFLWKKSRQRDRNFHIINYLRTGCPTKYDSWWIVQNVFFHNSISCLILKRLITFFIWQLYL